MGNREIRDIRMETAILRDMILFNIKCRRLAAEKRLEDLKHDLNDCEHERLTKHQPTD